VGDSDREDFAKLQTNRLRRKFDVELQTAFVDQPAANGETARSTAVHRIFFGDRLDWMSFETSPRIPLTSSSSD